MTIQFLGHSAFKIIIGEIHLLVDPFITGNPQASGQININDLKADYILLTHGHADHVMDADVIALNNGATVIGNYEVANYFTEKGCTTLGMNIGGCKEFEFGNLRMTHAVHTSSMPDGSYGGLAGGFLIQSKEGSIYIAGDTGLTKDMELIPRYFGKPDVSILPVGGFFTMDVYDALIASEILECNHIIGCHFDTFQPIAIDHATAKLLFDEKGKSLVLPSILESIDVAQWVK